MSTSSEVWPMALNAASFDGIEEGPLDDTEIISLRVQDESQIHNWKDFVSPRSCFHEVETTNENRKREDTLDQVNIGQQNLEERLHIFSLNDEDTGEFKPLKIHEDDDDTQEIILGNHQANTQPSETPSQTNTTYRPFVETKFLSSEYVIHNDNDQSDNHMKASKRPTSVPLALDDQVKSKADKFMARPSSVPPQNVINSFSSHRIKGMNKPHTPPNATNKPFYSTSSDSGPSYLSAPSTSIQVANSEQVTNKQSENGNDFDNDREILSVYTSRQAAKNLPVRPLTIGNSLNVASTYRPVSPFQPNFHHCSVATSVVLSTSLTPYHSSTSHYSSVALSGVVTIDNDVSKDHDVKEAEDISHRERLQPLGRDGLEVRNGPPWGIMMPMFQPSSRDSSLSSNDSTSASLFMPLQPLPSNQEEKNKLSSTSSIMIGTDLTPKASLKSIEPKEPMAAQLICETENTRTPLGKFHDQQHMNFDSPVSKILGSAFKATQKILEELQQRPIGALMDRSDEHIAHEEVQQRSIGALMDRSDEHIAHEEVQQRSIGALMDRSGEHIAHEEVQQRPIGALMDRSGEHIIQMELQQKPVGTLVDKSSGERIIQEKTSNLFTTVTESNVSKINHVSVTSIPRVTDVSNNFTQEKLFQDITFTNDGQSSALKSESADRKKIYHEFSPANVENSESPLEVAGVENLDSAIVPSIHNVERDVQSRSSMRNVNASFSDTHFHKQNVPILVSSSTAHSTPVDYAQEVLSRDVIERKMSPFYSKGDERLRKVEEDASTTKTTTTHFTVPRVRLQNTQTDRLLEGNQFTSVMTDSTLENSVRLSSHLPEASKVNADINHSLRESIKTSELGSKASEMSEFDRVASESLTWSNAVVKQFHEEMRSADYDVKHSLIIPEFVKSSLMQRTQTPNFDSGLSTSSTNDDVYRPKKLTRLTSESNEPIGIYDVRQSSGPGSTNRKRLALGKKPKEVARLVNMGTIYVSDGTTGTSEIENERHINKNYSRGMYSSGSSISGIDNGNNWIESGPDGQSTPKSDDYSMGQFSFAKNDNNKPDAYLDSCTTYDVEKPYQQVSRAFVDLEKKITDKPDSCSLYSDKPLTVTTGDFTINVTNTSNVFSNVNITTKSLATKVTQTWSTFKPVMSQLPVKSAQSERYFYSNGNEHETVENNLLPRNKISVPFAEPKMVTNQAEQRLKRSKHTKDRASQTTSKQLSSRTIDRERKKSVADMILENMMEDEREQKQRYEKLETKQKQTNRDLNQLWERFQHVFGRKSSKKLRRSHTQPLDGQLDSRMSTPSAPSSVLSSSSKISSRHQSDATIFSADSDVELQRFLLRVREFQTTDSSDYDENNSLISRTSSSEQSLCPNQSSSHAISSQPPLRENRPRISDSSTSMTSLAEKPMRGTLGNRKRHLPRNPAAVLGSEAVKKHDIPISLPMRLNVRNKEIMNNKTASSLWRQII
ncbi:uncharacterized protein LOC124443960 isoform X2 [Xenia sp. Carnegie-2017]|uniref:uncharacterized protein LOC124443960 isoform X2 n=1 Tax=Xenia sp. Carnegie-2017 TaxID=2897299 RepID=UPI001F04DBB3|nr:uncharacterized protein LOC124443960 isoform X2 [Xenia sp. Carnegie-2017]